MKKPELTAIELERLYLRLAKIDEELQTVMKYIDGKYVEITACEHADKTTENDDSQ